jgi:hypothetical protein
MKKTIFLLTSLLAGTAAKAEFIDFETDTIGTKANTFSTHAPQGVLFDDTLVTTSSGTWLRIVPNTLPFHAIGARALWAQGADTSAIKMTFVPEEVTFLSFLFSNDQVGGDVGRLRLYDGTGNLVDTIYEAGDASPTTWESMTYFQQPWQPSVKTAVFDMGTAVIVPPTGPFATLPNFLPIVFTPGAVAENIDNVQFTPVPEVQTYASLFGVALVGAEMLRRRRRATA